MSELKTHCAQGYEYTPKNTRYDERRKHRVYRKCDSIWQRDHRKRRRAEREPESRFGKARYIVTFCPVPVDDGGYRVGAMFGRHEINTGLTYVRPEDAAFPVGMRFRKGSTNYIVRQQVNRLKLEVVKNERIKNNRDQNIKRNSAGAV